MLKSNLSRDARDKDDCQTDRVSATSSILDDIILQQMVNFRIKLKFEYWNMECCILLTSVK